MQRLKFLVLTSNPMRFFRLPLVCLVFVVNTVYGKPLLNCGQAIQPVGAKNIVTLNQHTTELLLQLQLEDRMAGTAFADDDILHSLSAAYTTVPILSDYYPSREQMLIHEADFIVAGFSSAFSTMGVGEREWWQEKGVQTYLLPSNCQPEESLEQVWQAIHELGHLFGVEDRAEIEVERQKRQLEKRLSVQTKPKVLLWLRGYDAPYVAGGWGIGHEIITRGGGINAAADIPRPWGNLTWEAVLLAKPDLIVMVDSNWSPAKDKSQFISQQSGLNQTLPSIKTITMPFSETTAGIRTVDGILRLNQALFKLESL